MRIAAADWSMHPRKRWVCECVDGFVSPPQQVKDAAALLSGGGPAVVGFDFPIGMPEAYCLSAGIGHFYECLDRDWLPTNHPHLAQPFFPHTPNRKAAELEQALGVSKTQWLRRCDHATNAGALFWLIGPKQVGRAAITGWREVLRNRPADWKIWPFDAVNVSTDRWVAEIYPALGYPPNFGKRDAQNRRAYAGELLSRARGLGLQLHTGLESMVQDGFGPGTEGEDPFDAFVGVLGMVASLREEAPTDEAVRRWEGWILGAGCKTRPR